MFSKPVKTKTDQVNEKIARISSATEVQDVRSIPNFKEILSQNPGLDKVLGYFVEIPLSEYATCVPNAPKFPDREGNYYEEGQFDAPLFTLKEWRNNWPKVHPGAAQPDLLVNANWFNVWDSGVANVGQKINPRTQPRTYLIGLSISDGELVSTHKVLDQNNVGLDAVVFEKRLKTAQFISHDEIDLQLQDSNFYENKDAVSGFLILKNSNKLKTPDLNNNHFNRLPRSGIGYRNDSNTIILMVIHNPDRSCGVTAEEFAKLFEELGCTDAINLDNSGSVELYYEGLGSFGKQEVTVQTQTCDAGAKTERPKPNCLGFKNVSRPTFFAKDDSDLPKRAKTAPKEKPSAKGDESIDYTYYIKS
ncbi:Exopolysaccharide biosynthesis protein related to N-acetylglucosamine-1-phosphodiester alpha-N-acetylglucosaminidase [Legionella wadsworthii]|uniref:Exopolysaccharide biosynthesis protein related to N-acetylglucosamine-1-phosphodiester alpha-N-acetylglucosaminidase n=1 Tax=Legionella wadsworthii TaxID=28088 RepID=A0A378LUD1_9GAMM|nr:phosphodiester glycosidase family protein [Legionella wadsworthii]STY31183.1 Exopolysaccharide biosynthesis protein related to N-acetylglucosamine-1-phosphodiester alpha-N-acetylglucosaminidase [Legionella wadsworthii]